MGHGDALVIADANFPARRLCTQVLTMQGANSTSALKAVLTVFPQDEEEAPFTMSSPDGPLAIHSEFATECRRHGVELRSIDRHQFYDQAGSASAVIRTGEVRPYGNIIIYKGVVTS